MREEERTREKYSLASETAFAFGEDVTWNDLERRVLLNPRLQIQVLPGLG